ncbi:MAG: hypothetical protein UF228_07510 [Lachnospiraceae bacterium]|nr:hypothetical protein [Lachnospiraceae bacterium]
MNNEKREALYIAGVYYVVFAVVFILLAFAFKNDTLKICTMHSAIFAMGCLVLSDFYKRSEDGFFILNIISILLLAPILVFLSILDICYAIIGFISRLIKGGGEND